MGSFALTLWRWRLAWHLAVGIVRRVVALVFLRQMKTPVGLEITADPQRPQAQDGFGALHAPAGPGHLHTVFDEVAARAFDHPCGNGETRRQIRVVMQEIRILAQIVDTLIHRGALLSVRRRAVAVRRMLVAT